MRALSNSGADEQGGPNDEITIKFEERSIPCRRGETLAAALTAAGELRLRHTRSGDDRGMFCGMGVCQECLVEIDGRPAQRACMTVVDGPVTVRRQIPDSPLSCTAPAPPLSSYDDNSADEPDVLVIGGGPGGLTAASIVAEAGANVVLLDERPELGGQFYKQPNAPGDLPNNAAQDRQFTKGRELIERARRSGAELLSGMEVWGAFAPSEIAAADGNRSRIFRPRRTIVAAGAYERGLPLPGWTLPGVMTTGAAQTLLRGCGVLPGKRILIGGNGPFNIQVGMELKKAGAEVVAVAELAKAPGLSSLASLVGMASSSPGLLAKGIYTVAWLRRAGVPVLHGCGLVSIEQTEAGLRVNLGSARSDGIEASTYFDVDVVCMGYGFQPNNEILRSLGCEHEYDARRGHLVVGRNDNCETTVDGVYAVGDCCGLRGAPATLDEGLIAGIGVAETLGLSVSDQLVKVRREARVRLKSHARFQSALWDIYAAPRYQSELATSKTIICRCENVDMETIEKVLNDGTPSIGDVKRRTRLGMGRCQGRYCAPVIASILSERQGRALDEFALFAPRAPIKPIRIADIVKASR